MTRRSSEQAPQFGLLPVPALPASQPHPFSLIPPEFLPLLNMDECTVMMLHLVQDPQVGPLLHNFASERLSAELIDFLLQTARFETSVLRDAVSIERSYNRRMSDMNRIGVQPEPKLKDLLVSDPCHELLHLVIDILHPKI